MKESVEKLEELLKVLDSLNVEFGNQKLDAILNRIAALIEEMKLKLELT